MDDHGVEGDPCRVTDISHTARLMIGAFNGLLTTLCVLFRVWVLSLKLWASRSGVFL
jgi:hypothetical protein